MTKQRASRKKTRKAGGSRRAPSELVAPLVPTDPEAMVMSGNKPHITLFYDGTFEDVGLDVLHAVHPEHL